MKREEQKPTNEIYVLLPNYNREGYGEPYGYYYYDSKEHAEQIQSAINTNYYEYDIITLTKSPSL